MFISTRPPFPLSRSPRLWRLLNSCARRAVLMYSQSAPESASLDVTPGSQPVLYLWRHQYQPQRLLLCRPNHPWRHLHCQLRLWALRHPRHPRHLRRHWKYQPQALLPRLCHSHTTPWSRVLGIASTCLTPNTHTWLRLLHRRRLRRLSVQLYVTLPGTQRCKMSLML
jgi:hypothetical protein